MNIVSIIGARPQFVKAATVSRALAAEGLSEVIVHTGQHYDDEMSGQFLKQLGINNVVADFAVGSGSQAHQTAHIMTAFNDFLDHQPSLPDAVIVYGDTNSTIGAGLVVSKLDIPLIHVEAGLRSYNRKMPEEVNRVVVDHLSDMLFCSSPVGVENLRKEGIVGRVYDVGDVMLDAFLHYSEYLRQMDEELVLPDVAGQPYVLVTIHRPSNTDDPQRLQLILHELGKLDMPCIWPVHPRNKHRLVELDVPACVHTISPVGYLEMLSLLKSCNAVVTDSGGLQKEAHWAKRPCVTIRDETEWSETLDGGWNVLCDPAQTDLAALLAREQSGSWQQLYGDGKASGMIAGHIKAFLEGGN